MAVSLPVGLGEIVVSKNTEDVLVAYGLGSCLGIGMFDPAAGVAGLLHAILPSPPTGDRPGDATGKYVDRGILNLIARMEAAGADPRRFVIRMAGGANMLVAPGFSQALNIGSRNIDAAQAVLSRLKLRVSGQEVGGSTGRTVRFYVTDGRMTIRSVGNQEREV